ncbi:MAG: hypothetical protein LQ342_008326 [Letrouitia transgressa]|nr:MAG: hypothetical protein LQ342_008326 [Letrouitia transgressa]
MAIQKPIEALLPTPLSTSRPTVICVFCGASPGTSPTHLAAARSLAHVFHAHSITLVYGGGTQGLMGEIARTLVSLSGPASVHGVIPEALLSVEQQNAPNRQIAEGTYGRMTIVKDMHSRKNLMAKEVIEGGPGSGFVALSGGYGTLEELMEVATWNQLGIHGKGVVVFNVEGYYDGLLAWVRTAVSKGFIAPGNAGILVEALDAEEAVRQLREYRVSEDRFQLEWSQN